MAGHVERTISSGKRHFAGEIEDHGFTYGEVMGYLRITIQDIIREHPGHQPAAFSMRYALSDEGDNGLKGYWFWEVRIM